MSGETIEYLSVDKVECEAQVRGQFTDDSLIGLARSIQETRGVLQPIRVRRAGERFVVVDGERRLRAARLIKLSEIPAIVESTPLSDGEVLHRQIIANIQRSDLSPCEKARAIQRLLETTQWPAAEAAGRLGLSNGTISRLRALLSLPEEIRQDIEAGKIPASAGYELSRLAAEPEKQVALARELAQGRLTRDGVAGAVKSGRNGNAEREATPLKRVRAVVNGRSVTVAGESLTLEMLIEMLQDLLTRARRARTQGLEIKSFVRSLRQVPETQE